jgi:DNA-formamidopyrimidine glycosylase
MPELPEITLLARQMNAELVGKTIVGVEVLQPKCLNVPLETFAEALTGARLLAVNNRGKWLFVETDRGWLLLNLGMGGEILLVSRASLPEKHRLIFDFTDGVCLAINFWWFGYAHYVRPGELADHGMTTGLGPNALDLSADDLAAFLRGRKGRVKALLLDQGVVAGIGNSYVHDILFQARLHPLRPAAGLTPDEVNALADAVQDILRKSIAKGGAFYEMNLYGQKEITERHRHRYEVNPRYIGKLEKAGLIFSATNKNRMECLELADHPFYFATQFHPEFKSRPTRPSPPYLGFVEACRANKRTK